MNKKKNKKDLLQALNTGETVDLSSHVSSNVSGLASGLAAIGKPQHDPPIELPENRNYLSFTRTSDTGNVITFDVTIKTGVTGVNLTNFGFQAYRKDAFGNTYPFKVSFTPATTDPLKNGVLRCESDPILVAATHTASTDEIVITILTKKKAP